MEERITGPAKEKMQNLRCRATRFYEEVHRDLPEGFDTTEISAHADAASFQVWTPVLCTTDRPRLFKAQRNLSAIKTRAEDGDPDGVFDLTRDHLNGLSRGEIQSGLGIYFYNMQDRAN